MPRTTRVFRVERTACFVASKGSEPYWTIEWGTQVKKPKNDKRHEKALKVGDVVLIHYEDGDPDSSTIVTPRRGVSKADGVSDKTLLGLVTQGILKELQ